MKKFARAVREKRGLFRGGIWTGGGARRRGRADSIRFSPIEATSISKEIEVTAIVIIERGLTGSMRPLGQAVGSAATHIAEASSRAVQRLVRAPVCRAMLDDRSTIYRARSSPAPSVKIGMARPAAWRDT